MSNRKIGRCRFAENTSDDPMRETIAECQYPIWLDCWYTPKVYVMASDCRKMQMFQRGEK